MYFAKQHPYGREGSFLPNWCLRYDFFCPGRLTLLIYIFWKKLGGSTENWIELAFGGFCKDLSACYDQMGFRGMKTKNNIKQQTSSTSIWNIKYLISLLVARDRNNADLSYQLSWPDKPKHKTIVKLPTLNLVYNGYNFHINIFFDLFYYDKEENNT